LAIDAVAGLDTRVQNALLMAERKSIKSIKIYKGG